MPPTSPKSPKGVRGGPIDSGISKQNSEVKTGTKILIINKGDKTPIAQHKLLSDANVIEREKAIKAKAQAEELRQLETTFSNLDSIFNEDDHIFKQLGSKIPHTTHIKDTIKRIQAMISGLSYLQHISVKNYTEFTFEYPDIEQIRKIGSAPLQPSNGEDVFVAGTGPFDLPLNDPAVDAGNQGQASQEQIEKASSDVQKGEHRIIQKEDPKVIDSYIETKLRFYSSNRTQMGACSELMKLLIKRFTETPNGKYLRVSPAKLQQMITGQIIGTHINIPKLQIKLYKEFMEAITRYRTIPFNKSRYALIELLFVKIQRIIRDFCIIADTEWSTGMCPSNFATYMHSHHHYFNFFKIFYALAKKLKPGEVPDERVKNVIRFLCKSVFIILCDTHIEEVVNFIVGLRSIAVQINDPRLKGPDNITHRKQLIVHLLEPVRAELSSNMMTNKSVIRSIFFRYFIAYIPEYIWLQRLIIEDDDNDEVFVTKDEWDSILRVKFSLDAEVCDSLEIGDCSQSSSSSSGGGRTKKRGRTNKSKKNIKNKKSGRNKKVRGNNKSRRNQKRS
jgi:hypothetical protein